MNISRVVIVVATVACTVILSGSEASAATLVFFEGFDDDYFAGQNVPDLADPTLSSTFSPLDVLITGQLTLRGPGTETPCPVTGCVILDFVNGGGSILTLKFTTPFVAKPISTITFDVSSFGSDGGELNKYVSNDGVNFTQVGDASDAIGGFGFNFLGGSTDNYFRLQVGSQDIFDGIRVDNFQAIITDIPEPSTAFLLALGLTALGIAGGKRRQR